MLIELSSPERYALNLRLQCHLAENASGDPDALAVLNALTPLNAPVRRSLQLPLTDEASGRLVELLEDWNAPELAGVRAQLASPLAAAA